MPYEALGTQARQWVAKIEADPTQPATPWFKSSFSQPLQFIDYGGYEARQSNALVKEDDTATTQKEVLAEGGIFLSEQWAATERNVLMRSLMGPASDGYPGLIIDPCNPLLIHALGGGLVFRKPTPDDPVPIEYMKDGIHDNVYEALMYGIVGTVPLKKDSSLPPLVSFPDRLRVEAPPTYTLFHEGRPGKPKNGW
jgi:hypothetical protein